MKTLKLLLTFLMAGQLFAIENENVRNCEFFVNSFKQIYTGDVGRPSTNHVIKLAVNKNQTVEQIGLWLSYVDNEGNKVQKLKTDAKKVSENLYHISFHTKFTSPVTHKLDVKNDVEFAFFADLKNNDSKVLKRFWISSFGKNFTLYEALSNASIKIIPHGVIFEANPKSSIFNEKFYCLK